MLYFWLIVYRDNYNVGLHFWPRECKDNYDVELHFWPRACKDNYDIGLYFLLRVYKDNYNVWLYLWLRVYRDNYDVGLHFWLSILDNYGWSLPPDTTRLVWALWLIPTLFWAKQMYDAISLRFTFVMVRLGVLTAEPLNLASFATAVASIVDVTPFLIFCQ